MRHTERSRAETLNAYLDGELDAADAARLEQCLAAEPRLRRQLDEFRKIRALTRAAYNSEVSESGTTALSPRWRRTGYALAAGLLIALGVGIDHWLHPAQPADDLLAALPANAQVIQPTHAVAKTATNERRAIFHVHSANPLAMRATLDQVQKLVQRYNASGKPLHVEIVANAEGLNMLRADTSSARDQIARLHEEHPNIAFLACGNTISRLKHERGVEVKLLPQARITSSAFDQILLRLQQGWVYISL